MRWKKEEAALVGAIIALATGLRLWSIGYDLPYVFHPDEPAVIDAAMRIFKSGDLNPHFFNYPSLVFYLHAAGYALYYGFGRLVGTMSGPADVAGLSGVVMGATFAPDPTVVLIGRLISLVFGVATVFLVYLIGRRLTGRPAVGALAAALLAVFPHHIYHSRVITSDGPATFFVMLTFYAAVLIFREGRTRHYVVAAVAVGLTAAGKYNGGLVGLVLPVAHFLRTGPAGWRDIRLYLAVPLVAAAFLLAMPYALLDYPAFSEALIFEANHYAAGHDGMEGDTLRWYVNFLWTTMTILPVLALAQIGRGLLQRSRATILLASFPVAYFLFISRFIVRNDRTILPLLPFIFLLAAVLLVDLGDVIRRIEAVRARRAAMVVLVAVVAVLLAMPARAIILNNIQRETEIYSGPVAGEWLVRNAPPGSRIALEPYGPYIDPALHDQRPFSQLIDHPPEWYRAEAFDYLVFSKRMYGRYYAQPALYPDQVARYDELFAAFELVQEFSSRTTEIRIYWTGNR